MFNVYDFDTLWRTECNLQHFTRNTRINNLDDFERDEADAYLWRAELLNAKEKKKTKCYIINKCLVQKSKTQVTSYEVRVQINELRVQIYELRVPIHELRV